VAALVFRQARPQRSGDGAEQARLWVARLRTRRHRADLDVAEAQGGESRDALAVLVEAGGQADAVRERDAEGLRGQGLRLVRQQGIEAAAIGQFDRAQAGAMGGFRVQREQEGAGEGIQAHGLAGRSGGAY